MFDCTKLSIFSGWPESDDIYQFAHLVLMYCNLSRSQEGPPYTDAMKSRMFLTHVKGQYHTVASHFNILVGTYCPCHDGVTRCPDPLPHHLTVMELARTLSEEVMLLTSSMTTSTTPYLHVHHTQNPLWTPPHFAAPYLPLLQPLSNVSLSPLDAHATSRDTWSTQPAHP